MMSERRPETDRSELVGKGQWTHEAVPPGCECPGLPGVVHGPAGLGRRRPRRVPDVRHDLRPARRQGPRLSQLGMGGPKMPTTPERDETFEVVDKHLVRKVVPARGRPYEHRCPLAAFEQIAHTAEELGAQGFTLESLLEYERNAGRDVTFTNIAVALAFLRRAGHPRRPLPAEPRRNGRGPPRRDDGVSRLGCKRLTTSRSLPRCPGRFRLRGVASA